MDNTTNNHSDIELNDVTIELNDAELGCESEDTSISTEYVVEAPPISLAAAIRALTAEIPLNDFGMPTGVYRADLLPFHDYQPPSVAPHIAPPLPLPLLLEHTDTDTDVDVDEHVVPRVDVGDGSPEDVELLPALISGDSDPSASSEEEVEVEVEVYRIAGFPAHSLNQAFMPLQYDEGFPAFEDGSPFWCRLGCEPQEAYRAFDHYIRMAQGNPGGVVTEKLDADEDLIEDHGKAASGTRSINALVALMHPELDGPMLLAKLDEYREYSYLYYWGLRAKAYDLFRVVEFQHQSEIRALQTQDEHYLVARKLRQRIVQYMGSAEEFWDLMTPKVAIDLLKTTTSLERISAGLPSSGPIPAGIPHSSPSFEMTYRTIAQQGRSDDTVVATQDGAEAIEGVLNDPEKVAILQELIIKTTGAPTQ